MTEKKSSKFKQSLNLKSSYELQQIDQKLNSLLKPIFHGNKKEFILISNLVKNWEEIVGKKYAGLCYPKTCNFAKGESSGAKLTIAVFNPAVGFFLESNAELIIERIAAFYGFKSIAKIIIKQEPKDIDSNKIKEIKLTKVQEDFLQKSLKDVESPELADVLRRLGGRVLTDKN